MNSHAPKAGPPSPKTALLVGLAFVALLGAYLLGRGAPAATDSARDQTPTAEPTQEPSEAADSSAFVADLNGSGELIARVDFSADRGARVLCRQGEFAASGRLVVSYLDTSREPPALLAHDEIAKDVECSKCTVDVRTLAGDLIGLGSCPTVFIRRAFEPDPPTNMAFVVAEPPTGIVSALGVVIDCGVTELLLEDDELVLYGESPDAAFLPLRAYPPIRFARRGARFEANDLPLLRHYCNASGSQQLFGYLTQDEAWYADRTELSYLETESEIGVIGWRRQVLIGLTPEQCNLLYEAQNDRLRGGPTTLAEVTGLEPPDGIDDWFLSCQIR